MYCWTFACNALAAIRCDTILRALHLQYDCHQIYCIPFQQDALLGHPKDFKRAQDGSRGSESTIRQPMRPLRALGGLPYCQNQHRTGGGCFCAPSGIPEFSFEDGFKCASDKPRSM
eukprot:4487388-Pyramimonas_sp.AAC.1